MPVPVAGGKHSPGHADVRAICAENTRTYQASRTSNQQLPETRTECVWPHNEKKHAWPSRRAVSVEANTVQGTQLLGLSAQKTPEKVQALCRTTTTVRVRRRTARTEIGPRTWLWRQTQTMARSGSSCAETPEKLQASCRTSDTTAENRTCGDAQHAEAGSEESITECLSRKHSPARSCSSYLQKTPEKEQGWC